MTERLEITRRAAADRDACFDFICRKTPEGALRWLDAFEAAVEALLIACDYGEAPESANHQETVWQKLFSTRHGQTYRLLFLVRADVIYVCLQLRLQLRPKVGCLQLGDPQIQCVTGGTMRSTYRFGNRMKTVNRV